MKKALCLVAVLALVSVANADVRLFLTPAGPGVGNTYGLDIPANAFTPTLSTVDAAGNNFNAYDYSGADFNGGPIRCAGMQVTPDFPGTGTIPAANYNPGTPQINYTEGQWFYIWFQFNRDANGNFVQDNLGGKVNGLRVGFTQDPNNSAIAPISGLAYYLCNDKSAFNLKRWDGAITAGAPELQLNPQVLAGVNSSGLINNGTDSGNLMYAGRLTANANPSNQWRLALLGAVKFSGPGTVNLHFVPSEGRTGDPGINYDSGAPGNLWGGTGTVIPEPASILLLGVLSLLRRR